jgi:hypothetical protein
MSLPEAVYYAVISGLRLTANPRCAIAHRGVTVVERLCRADPIAVKAVGHAVAEMHQRDGA